MNILDIFVAGRAVTSLMLLVFCFMLILIMELNLREKIALKIRRMAGVDAIDEAIGIAVEKGKPVMFLPGQGKLGTGRSGGALAAISTFSYVVKTCAEKGAKLLAPTMLPTVYSIMQDIVKQAYIAAGKREEYDPSIVTFVSPKMQAYMSKVGTMMEEERIGSCIMFGSWAGATLWMAERSFEAGAFSIGGTDSPSTIPFFLAVCDRCIMGEEIYAVGAYLSEDKAMIGSIGGQDIGKIIIILLLLIGSILVNLGVDVLPWFKM